MRYTLLMLFCLLGLYSCKPKDKIMHAAEQFYEEGIISEINMDSLVVLYNKEGTIKRSTVLKAVFRSSSVYAKHAEPPYPVSEFAPAIDDTLHEYFAKNKSNIESLYAIGFLEPDEYDYMQNWARIQEELDYPTALMLIAHIINRKDKRMSK